ncbi:unnamed protein product [Moneuplotes crassus]|uniref:Uncharacterized protein n=1 Tax=Euplotes crassus TaxID=5936 RepID=A0AAD1XR89_EUPCR|nr:unnamed protein product [Moneuplotes crassus]
MNSSTDTKIFSVLSKAREELESLKANLKKISKRNKKFWKWNTDMEKKIAELVAEYYEINTLEDLFDPRIEALSQDIIIPPYQICDSLSCTMASISSVTMQFQGEFKDKIYMFSLNKKPEKDIFFFFGSLESSEQILLFREKDMIKDKVPENDTPLVKAFSCLSGTETIKERLSSIASEIIILRVDVDLEKIKDTETFNAPVTRVKVIEGINYGLEYSMISNE